MNEHKESLCPGPFFIGDFQPFKESRFVTIEELYPDKVIRWDDQEYSDERLSEFILVREIHERLSNEYNIPVVDYSLGVSYFNDESRIIAFADRIYGYNLNDLSSCKVKPEGLSQEVINLKDGLSRYLSDLERSGGFHCEDIFHGEQYVFGKKISDIQPRIYLVDIDPYISKYPFPTISDGVDGEVTDSMSNCLRFIDFLSTYFPTDSPGNL